PPPPRSPLFPYTTLFRSLVDERRGPHFLVDRPEIADVLDRDVETGGQRVGAQRIDHARVQRWELPKPCHGLVLGDIGHVAHPGRSEEHTSELQSPYDLVC